VLLIELHRYGGTFSSHNLSHGGYRSTHCLINYSYFPAIDELYLFNSLEIDLAGYEEWLWLNSIKTSATEKTISVEYIRRDPLVYEIDEGTVTIEYHVSGVGEGKWLDRNISLSESASLVYDPKVDLTLLQMRQKARELEDLLLVLTNSDYILSWPNISISVGDDNRWFEWYYFRRRSAVDAPRAHERMTNFSKLEDIVGTIVSNWLRKRQGVGPGFYLYLGLRRSAPSYIENRFVTLITALEALHRKIKNDAGERGVKDKVAGIIESVVDKKDKKWLTNRLKNAHEPNLEKRLFDLFTSVDLLIDKKRLRLFAAQCSMIRNDLSHFGEQRNGIEYQAFIRDVTNKNEALSIIYHMIILHEIGIDQNMIRDWIYNRSFSAEAYLVEANLLDKRVPQPADPPAPIANR
jgi:hypothetical protein